MRATSNSANRIGWIGTGVMGASMCGHLIASGISVVVTTRSRERAEPLIARGATWAPTAAEVAAQCNIVFSIVGLPSDLREVVFGADGILTTASERSVLVDMTTSDPSLAREVDTALAARGAASLDAPVTGGDRGAREGTLSVLVGGNEAVLDRVRPLLETMAKTIVHHGPSGSGQHAKLVNQTIIASGMIGIAEGFLYARQAGLDFDKLFESIAGGAAGSWSLSNYGPRIVAGDFAPGFMVDHFLKDMRLAVEQGRELGVVMPGTRLAIELYTALSVGGRGREGTQSLVHQIASDSGLEW